MIIVHWTESVCRCIFGPNTESIFPIQIINIQYDKLNLYLIIIRLICLDKVSRYKLWSLNIYVSKCRTVHHALHQVHRSNYVDPHVSNVIHFRDQVRIQHFSFSVSWVFYEYFSVNLFRVKTRSVNQKQLKLYQRKQLLT